MTQPQPSGRSVGASMTAALPGVLATVLGPVKAAFPETPVVIGRLDAAKLTRAAKPDDKAVKAALRKLEDNCKACHAVFRDAS